MGEGLQSNQIQIIFFKSIRFIDRTLTGATTPGKKGPWSYNNDVVLYTPQISKTGTSPSDAAKCHIQNKHILSPDNRIRLNLKYKEISIQFTTSQYVVRVHSTYLTYKVLNYL